MPRNWSKSDLVDAVAEKSGLGKKQAAAAVDTVFDTISEALANRDKVQLMGFGTFETRERKERRARNMQSGEEMVVPAGHSIGFRPGKALKESVK